MCALHIATDRWNSQTVAGCWVGCQSLRFSLRTGATESHCYARVPGGSPEWSVSPKPSEQAFAEADLYETVVRCDLLGCGANESMVDRLITNIHCAQLLTNLSVAQITDLSPGLCAAVPIR